MLLQTTNGQLWVVQEGEDNRVCSLQHLGLGNLEIMRSLARGDAGMLNCQGFLAAAARLPQETLGQVCASSPCRWCDLLNAAENISGRLCIEPP